MTQDNDKPHANNTPPYATGPTDVPAAGNDPDSRLRELKTQLARAESAGDERAAKAARTSLDDVRKEQRAVEREQAAQARRAAAQSDPDAQTREPVQRSTTPPGKTTTGGAKPPADK